MPIPITCHECAARFAVEEYLEGRLIRCPKCKADILVARAKQDRPTKRPIKSATTTRRVDEEEPGESAKKRSTEAARESVEHDEAKKPTPFSRKAQIILGIVGAFFVALVVSCAVSVSWLEQSKKSAFAYNQTFTNAQARLAANRIALSVTLDQHQAGKPLGIDDVGKVHQQLDDLRKTIDDIRDEMGTWSRPWGSRDVYRGYQLYLDHAQSELPKFAKLITFVGDGKREQAVQLLNELDADEEIQFRKIEKLQKEFAAYYGLSLAPRPMPPPRMIMNPGLQKLLKGP